MNQQTPNTYWHRQTTQTPLFSALLWSRPENRSQAGKLFIIGGNGQGFAVPATAYAAAVKAGIGTARVMLPDSLYKTIGRTFDAGEFAPSTPSGSFSRVALAEWMACAHWADGTLLAGELGNNSETAILLESFITKYPGALTITRDAFDYFSQAPTSILARPDTCVVISMQQLQQLFKNSRQPVAITLGIDLLRLVEALHNFTLTYPLAIVVKHGMQIVVAYNGQVSTTRLQDEQAIWRVQTAAAASVWWLQNPSQVFAALTTAVYERAA